MKYPDKELFDYVLENLTNLGVSIEDLGKVTYKLQKEYLPDLTEQACKDAVLHVLSKRDVLQHVAMAINLEESTILKHLIFFR